MQIHASNILFCQRRGPKINDTVVATDISAPIPCLLILFFFKRAQRSGTMMHNFDVSTLGVEAGRYL